jgi:hypothetical protein
MEQGRRMQFDSLKMLQISINAMKEDLGLSNEQIFDIVKAILKGDQEQ